jgi:hypothetical protein
MGSIGDCYDNAMTEAFWSRMQIELLDTAPVEDAGRASRLSQETRLHQTRGSARSPSKSVRLIRPPQAFGA